MVCSNWQNGILPFSYPTSLVTLNKRMCTVLEIPTLIVAPVESPLKFERFYLLALSLTSLLEDIMKTCSVVLTLKSVVEILWCDHSNETSAAVLFHGTICFSIFFKMKFGIFLKVWDLALFGFKVLID